jgi:preprotein translocase subunit YajC
MNILLLLYSVLAYLVNIRKQEKQYNTQQEIIQLTNSNIHELIY